MRRLGGAVARAASDTLHPLDVTMRRPQFLELFRGQLQTRLFGQRIAKRSAEIGVDIGVSCWRSRDQPEKIARRRSRLAAGHTSLEL